MVQPTTIQRAPRLWVALLGVAVFTVAAVLVAREIYRPRPDIQASQPVVAPSTSTAPPSSKVQPGPRDVMATQDAATHPQYSAIRQMLQEYYDAINARDYAKWRGTVTRARVETMPEGDWRRSYQSTKDGSILIYRIETAPQGRLRVLVGFTSVQAASDAPPEFPKECIEWHVVLPVTKEDNKWRVDTGPEAASPRHDECGTTTS